MKVFQISLKFIYIAFFVIVGNNSLAQKDTLAINFHGNGQTSVLIVYENNYIEISAYNKNAANIYSRKCDITDKSADYSFTYFDSGAVESIKLTLKNSNNDYKEIQYVEFDFKGGEVISKSVSGIGVELKDEGKSDNFEGGVVFRPVFKY